MTFSLKEHRLIYRNLSDFQDQTKYNSRNTQLKNEQQMSDHQQALADNQAQAASTFAQQGNESAAAKYQAEAQKLQEQSQSYDPTKLQNAQTTYNNAGQWQTYDSASGQITAADPLGAIDQSALKRLMDSGMTEGQARTQLGLNRENVQQSFNQAGTGLTPDALAMQQRAQDRGQARVPAGYVDTSTLTPQTNAGVTETAQQFEERKAAIEQRNTELLNQQKVQQEMDKKNASDNAASTAAANDAANSQPQQGQSALQLAIASLGPEGTLIGSALQEELNALKTQQEAAQANMQGDIAAANDSLSAYGEVLDKMRADSTALFDKMNEFTDTMQKQREETLAKQKESTIEQLKWQENKQTREARQALDKQINQMVTAQALGGGFGSSNWTSEIAEAEWRGEQTILDMQTEFGFKQADVDIQFTEQLNGIYEFYGQKKLDALSEYNSQLSTINQFSFAATEKTEDRKLKAKEDYRNTLANIAKEQAGKISKATDTVLGIQSQMRAEKKANEEIALDRIQYLLENYPRESVADAIRELGKDVTSFNVQTLIDNPTLEELERARKSVSISGGGGSGYISSFLPPEMQDSPKPEITFEDYIEQQLNKLESEASQSFTAEKRAQLEFENAAKWEDQYKAMYVEPIRNQQVKSTRSSLVSQYGENTVRAAESVIDGTYSGTNPVKNAASAFGVSETDVAIAKAELSRNGSVADVNILSPDQNKKWTSIRKELDGNDFYKIWKGAKSAISRITQAAKQGSASADIALINAFQNGIVDPGATVREGDVALIQSATSWFERIDPNFILQVARGEAKIPQSMRDQMLSLAQDIESAYGRDFKNIALPQFRQSTTLAGLPVSILDEYVGFMAPGQPGNIPVNKDVSDFVTNYFPE